MPTVTERSPCRSSAITSSTSWRTRPERREPETSRRDWGQTPKTSANDCRVHPLNKINEECAHSIKSRTLDYNIKYKTKTNWLNWLLHQRNCLKLANYFIISLVLFQKRVPASVQRRYRNRGLQGVRRVRVGEKAIRQGECEWSMRVSVNDPWGWVWLIYQGECERSVRVSVIDPSGWLWTKQKWHRF